jgi:hypothetical protein
MNFSKEQTEALAWARSTGMLVRWADGVWRGKGAAIGDDDFDTADIMELVKYGLLSLTSAGAVPVIEVSLPFERPPVCACDPGFGPPPSKAKRVLCEELDLGPCSEGYYERHPDAAKADA